LESGADAVLVLFNHGSQPAAADVAIRRPPGEYLAEDIVTSRTVKATRSGESVTVRADVAPQDVLVLRLTRK